MRMKKIGEEMWDGRKVKVRVKAGLGMVSGWEGHIIEIQGDKALVDFPYADIRWISLEDLEIVKKGE